MELENRLREIGSVVAGSIRVGTVYSVGLHELPPYLTEFLRTFPAVNVHLEYLRSNKIYEDLVEGKIDLGVVAYPAKRSQIVTIAFRHDELVLVVPPDDALAKQNQVSVASSQGSASSVTSAISRPARPPTGFCAITASSRTTRWSSTISRRSSGRSKSGRDARSCRV